MNLNNINASIQHHMNSLCNEMSASDARTIIQKELDYLYKAAASLERVPFEANTAESQSMHGLYLDMVGEYRQKHDDLFVLIQKLSELRLAEATTSILLYAKMLDFAEWLEDLESGSYWDYIKSLFGIKNTRWSDAVKEIHNGEPTPVILGEKIV